LSGSVTWTTFTWALTAPFFVGSPSEVAVINQVLSVPTFVVLLAVTMIRKYVLAVGATLSDW